MKVLTIKEPWATLIIDGYKKYEFRSWKTNYRGKILIHAGMTIENDILNRFNDYNLDCSCGEIIGEAQLVDCILVDEKLNKELRKIDKNVYGKSNHVETYAWKLENIVKYDKKIKIKGKLGLWNYNIKLKDICNPYLLYLYMSENISYGFLGKNGKKYLSDDIDFNNQWGEQYILETPSQILKTKIGTCWDQTELEREWFIKNNYIIKTFYEMVNLNYNNSYPTHTFLVFKDKKRKGWNWFENADYNNRGIHYYESLDQLIDFQFKKYKESLKDLNIKDDELKKTVLIEYKKPKDNISAENFIYDIMK